MASDHRRIASAALRVALFLLLGKVAGAAKEMVVAWRYGVSDVVDAYQYTFTLTTWLPVTLVGVLSIVLIPVLVRLHKQADHGVGRFLSQLNAAVLVAGVVLGGATYLCWPWVVQLFGQGLTPAVRAMSTELVAAFAPVAMLTVWAGVSAARLRARERHVNTLLDGVPAVFILAWVAAAPVEPGVGPLFWGTLVGTLVQAVWLQWLAARADGCWGRPQWAFSAPEWPMLMQAVGIMAIGQVAMSFVAPLDQVQAAALGQNANAALGYANRLLGLVLGLGAVSVGRAALPVLADVIAHGDPKRARRMAIQWSAGMVLAGTVLVGIGWLLAPWGVALVFERGAFTADDTLRVAHAFRWGLLQLPFYFGVLVLVQLLAGQHRYGVMTVIALANFGIKALLNPPLAAAMGLSGILLATSLMYALSYGCYLVAALRPVHGDVHRNSRKLQ